MSIKNLNSVFQDLASLKHFYAVASCGGFSKAARATGSSQPALSLGLQKLEKTLGAVLIDRKSRQFALTQEGVAVFNFCQKLEHSLKSMVGNFESKEFAVRRCLRIGTALSVGFVPLLSACTAAIKEKSPVELELSSDSTYSLLKGVLEGSLDAAIVPDDVSGSGLKFTKLLEDQIVFVVGRSHAKTVQPQFWPACLENIPLVTYPREAPMRALVDQLCLQKKLKFKTTFSVNSADALKLVIGCGGGGAFILRSLVLSELKTNQLIEVKLPFPLPKSAIMLATREGEHGDFIGKEVKKMIQI